MGGERGTGCRGRNQRGRYILNAICVPLKSIVRCGHEADCCLRDACLMPFRTPSESWGGGDPQGQGSSFCSAAGIYPGSIHDNRVAGQRTERRTCTRGSCFASAATSGRTHLPAPTRAAAASSGGQTLGGLVSGKWLFCIPSAAVALSSQARLNLSGSPLGWRGLGHRPSEAVWQGCRCLSAVESDFCEDLRTEEWDLLLIEGEMVMISFEVQLDAENHTPAASGRAPTGCLGPHGETLLPCCSLSA